MTWRFTHSRSTASELMDADDISYREFSDCLVELERINHLTLAYRPTLRWLARALRRTPITNTISVFDIGSGGGDMLRQVRRRFQKHKLALTGIDLNPWSKAAAEVATPAAKQITQITANIFDLPPEHKADYIISSLFAHHLADPELVRFIGWMESHAQQGWFINDLHRHWLPYYFIKAATRLLSGNRLIRNDAAVSVSRAFTRRDWQRLLQRAGVPIEAVTITWWFPFRYTVARRFR